MSSISEMQSRIKTLREKMELEVKVLKVAVLSSYTAQNLALPIECHLLARGFNPSIRFGAFDQYNQELRDSGSWLREWRPDVVFVALTTGTFLPDMECRLGQDADGEEGAKCRSRMEHLVESLNAYDLPCVRMVTLLDAPLFSPAGLADAWCEHGVSGTVRGCNDMLREYARRTSAVILVDFDMVCGIVGKRVVTDPTMYYMGRLALGGRAAEELADVVASTVNAAFGRTRKCIAVDLDNTIWGGTVGEDGVEGLVVGDGAMGRVYADVQKVLRAYRDAGILLAIVSKNNREDVSKVFRHHPGMLLKEDDFAVIQVNWESKSDNIEHVASELDIGLDSIVFVDDNATERLEVSTTLPMVEVLPFPDDVAWLPAILRGLPSLRVLTLTDEDRKRNALYSQERQRRELRTGRTTKDYLRDLDIRVKIRHGDDASLDRITQLINKTNQFNLRTCRYSGEDVKTMLTSPDWLVTTVQVSDRFGEMGLTGVALVRHTAPHKYFVDSLLLSCRVLSRGIERSFLERTLTMIPDQNATVEAEYLPSPRNGMTSRFYDEVGFSVVEESNKVRRYSLDLTTHRATAVDWIREE